MDNKKSECCGCYGCINICPKNAIYMEIDEEGFSYPVFNKKNCINCGLCEKVCPVKNEVKDETLRKTYGYACQNKKEEERQKSSSGGVFSLLCKEVIKNNGVVFGASFDKNLNLSHNFSENLKECEKFRGSKYVQSIIGETTYKKVEEFLELKKMVLFTGTPCQIKGLRLFLKKSYDNLITAEIVCHGVPSPKIFNLYKEVLGKRYKRKIKNINFRDKKTGWKGYSFSIETDNDIYSEKWYDNLYMKGFIDKLFLRPSCYNCKAKNFLSGSDITLGDYWGVEKRHEKFNDNKGTSVVFVHTEKGKNIINKISKDMNIEETDINYAILNNSKIKNSARLTNKRKKFFKEVKKVGMEEAIIKCKNSLVKEKMIFILSKVKDKIMV